MIDWDGEFKNAGRTILISNFKPNGFGARNIFQEDEPKIMKASEANGFRILTKTKHSVCFIRDEHERAKDRT